MNCLIYPRAWLDIEETMTYLRAEAGDEIAIRFWEHAQVTLNTLTQQPFLGRPRADLKPAEIRSWRINGFENWLVFYQVSPTEIKIFRIRHGMMDLPKIFRQG
jgi:plasmid stabilization system protein ParE